MRARRNLPTRSQGALSALRASVSRHRRERAARRGRSLVPAVVSRRPRGPFRAGRHAVPRLCRRGRASRLGGAEHDRQVRHDHARAGNRPRRDCLARVASLPNERTRRQACFRSIPPRCGSSGRCRRSSTGARGTASAAFRRGATRWPRRDSRIRALRIRDAGLTVTGYCRGGMFPAVDREDRRAAQDDNRRAVDEALTLGANA